jgi:hypothetical protein
MPSKKKIPERTRRLTRAEAEKLGVSYSAKRRVNADLKRITSKTVLYTDRQWQQARLGTTKEAYSKTRIHDLSKGRKQYVRLTYTQAKKIAKQYNSRTAQITYYVEKANYGTAGTEQGGWASTYLISPGSLEKTFDMLNSQRGTKGRSVFGQKKREFSIIVMPE